MTIAKQRTSVCSLRAGTVEKCKWRRGQEGVAYPRNIKRRVVNHSVVQASTRLKGDTIGFVS